MPIKHGIRLLHLLKETLLLMRLTGITPVEALGLLRDLLRSIREREKILEDAQCAEHPKWLYEQGI